MCGEQGLLACMHGLDEAQGATEMKQEGILPSREAFRRRLEPLDIMTLAKAAWQSGKTPD
jgi:hypothetical protein